MPKARTHMAGFRCMIGLDRLIIHEHALVGTTLYRKHPHFPTDSHTRAESARFVRGHLRHCADAEHIFMGQVILEPGCAVTIRL